MAFKHPAGAAALIFLILGEMTAAALEVRTADEALRLGDRALLYKKYGRAEPYYREAIRLRPKLAAPVIRLGLLEYAQARYGSAERLFESARGLKNDISSRKFLETALEKMRQERDLLSRIERATAAGETADLDALHALAAERLSGGRSFMSLVRPHLEHFLEQGPRPDVLRLLAEGYTVSSDPSTALYYYEKLIGLTEPDAELLRRWAEAAVNTGDTDTARLATKRALRQACRQRDRAGIRELTRWVRALPAFSARVEAWISSGDYARAYRELRKSLGRNPTGPWAVVQMARIYEELGRTAQAENLYRKAVRWNPDDPGAHYALGKFYLHKKKKFEQALEELKLSRSLLEDSLEFAPDPKVRERIHRSLRAASQSLIYLYLEVLQEPAQAAAELAVFERRGWAGPEEFYLSGLANLRIQKRTMAYQYFKKVIAADPKSELAASAEAAIESMRATSREGFELG